MNKIKSYVYIIILFAFLFLRCSTVGQEKEQSAAENFYSKSLHYSNRGIEFIYSREHGGLERLTDMSAEDLGCLKSKCHVTTCDVCHKKEINGKTEYSKEAARSPKICHQCHGEIEKDNPDIHFAKGMVCMDCHTTREMHGDGTIHNTFMEPGFFDVQCEKCHPSIKPSMSHTVHKGKLDCTPCHSAEYYTCLNCHIDTRLKEKKDVQVILKGMYFLVNHDEKVTLGNMLSYVYKDKTMITFAPSFSHSIKKEGRKCQECHNSKIIKDIKDDKFNLVKWEKDEMKNIEGVIPVLEGMKWNLVYLDRVDTVWVPLKNPAKPLINYSGYCSPITPEQFGKLIKTVETK